MKPRLNAIATLLLAPCLAFATVAAKPRGTLRVEGDSTLHKWSETTSAVEADFELADEKTSLASAVAAGAVKSMEVRVPVAALSSGEKGLDKNMRKAMKAEEFPTVVYRMTEYKLAKAADGTLTAATTGQLTIAGKTKSVPMTMTLAPGDGSTAVRGSYDLLMSDYGIAPPKLMMGAIKVRDPVTVRFDLVLGTPHKEN